MQQKDLGNLIINQTFDLEKQRDCLLHVSSELLLAETEVFLHYPGAYF